MTDEQLRQLVHHFYGRVREDDLLGPVFDRAIDDWPAHLEKLSAFWSSVMNRTGRYKGSPMAAHLGQRDHIRAAMFERWLALWRDSAKRLMAPEDAAAVIATAERIGESLSLALFFRLDQFGSKGAAPLNGTSAE